MDDRYVTIRGRKVRHSTAVRDWRCGLCGARLVTIWTESGWRTVCGQERSHDPNQFIHRAELETRLHQQWLDKAEAEEVLAHLPAEMRQAIEEEECRSKD